jgi:hypothetical protein
MNLMEIHSILLLFRISLVFLSSHRSPSRDHQRKRAMGGTQMDRMIAFSVMVSLLVISVYHELDQSSLCIRKKTQKNRVMIPTQRQNMGKRLNPGFMMAMMDQPRPPRTRPLMGDTIRYFVALGKTRDRRNITQRIRKKGMSPFPCCGKQA